MEFVRGMRSKLASLPPRGVIEVGVAVSSRLGSDIDVCCFGLDPNGRLSDDRYMVFYNQPETPEGAIRLLAGASPARVVFQVEVDKLPASIARLCFTASIDGERDAMSNLSPGLFRITSGNDAIARFAFAGSDFGPQRSLILAELYRNNGWRLWAVGQGFVGGLDSLLTHYGGVIADAPVPPSQDTPCGPALRLPDVRTLDVPPPLEVPPLPDLPPLLDLPPPLDTGDYPPLLAQRPPRDADPAPREPVSVPRDAAPLPRPAAAATRDAASRLSRPPADPPGVPAHISLPVPDPRAELVEQAAPAVDEGFPPGFELPLGTWLLPRDHEADSVRVVVDGIALTPAELHSELISEGGPGRYGAAPSHLRYGSLVRIDYDVNHARS